VDIFSERASWRLGLEFRFQSILQKKIIRLAFFGSFFGNEKKNKTTSKTYHYDKTVIDGETDRGQSVKKMFSEHF